MRFLSVIVLLTALILPPVALAEVQTFTATHTYIMGDHDSKDDARQRCLLETKRKILEQAGVYIESASEVKDLQLTKDKITSFAAAVMQVKDTKEDVSFQQGHMTMTLVLKADVDLAEVRKQLAARQLDAGVRDTVSAQQERLKRLEAQLEAMQRQQSPGQASTPPMSNISAEVLQTIQTQAAQGDANAQNDLGLLYYTGQGVQRDYTQAQQWFEKAAAQGHVGAQIFLGALYDNGQGVPQDYAKARQWYEKAAAQGDANAQNNLGEMYDTGIGVPQDFTMARGWYEKAAVQSNAMAQFQLGVLYEFGRGIPQDYTRAGQWYAKAAAQGYAKAQSRFGLLYAGGRGIPQDEAKARYWLEKAVAQGSALAESVLGSLYLGQDDVRAYMWFSLSAAHSTGDGQKFAVDSRDRVARRMTPDQIAEAQRLAQQCQSRGFKGC